MRAPFKIEIFNRDFTFKSWAPVSKNALAFDYLTLEGSSIECEQITAENGDFCRLSDIYGAVIFEGIIDSVDVGNITTVKILPLQALLDVEASFLHAWADEVETDLKNEIEAAYVNTLDTEQQLAINVSVPVSPTAGYIYPNKDTGSLYELVRTALTNYGVVCKMELDFTNSRVNVDIGKVSGEVSIEALSKGIINKAIVEKGEKASLNKVTILTADGQNEATYFLHTDGTISTTDADRITPVKWAFKVVTVRGSFSDTAEAEANRLLSTSDYQNDIEITFPISSKIIDAEMEIGQTCNIITAQGPIKSILTGRKWTDNAITLIFGCIRSTLTKQLILGGKNGSYA